MKCISVREEELFSLAQAGFTLEDARAMRRAAATLHCWYDEMCGLANSIIERDEDGKCWRHVHYNMGRQHTYRYQIRDLEGGAMLRAEQIAAKYGAIVTFHSDPRGASIKMRIADRVIYL